jgi:hypothetical protein
MRLIISSLVWLNYASFGILGLLILFLNETLYGFPSNHNTTSPQYSHHKNDSTLIDTLTKLGLKVQVNGQIILVADLEFPNKVKWKEALNPCNRLENGWHLPSNDELSAMHTQLHPQGQGNFNGLGYWSTQEVDEYTAWVMYFLNGEKHLTRKLMPIKVRPVCAP